MADLANKKFLVCCANGAGSSLMMKMTLQKVLNKYGAAGARVHHCAITEAKTAAANFDVVFCARNFARMFDAASKSGTTVLPLKNIMSDREMEQALKGAGLLG